MLYRDFIINLYKNPLNKRAIPKADITHSGANVTCGDRVRIYVKLKNESIDDISFEGEGCAITFASASLLTENAKGKTLDEIIPWNSVTVFGWLEIELGPARIKCGLLPLETLQEGIKKIYKQQAVGAVL